MPKIEDIPDDLLARAMAEPEPEAPSEPAPTVANAKRSRAKRATAAKDKAGPNPATTLIKAIKFVSASQPKNGTVGETYCHMSQGWVAASNGVLTVATPIEEDLEACPQSTTFLAALNKVETDLSITQLSAGFLSVASGDFRGVIPCAPADQVPITPPDAPVAVISDAIKAGFEAVLKIPNDASPKAEYAGVLLQSGSIVATNGAVIFEYWHGIDLPPNLIIPKVALQAVIRSGKTLTQLGFSQTSVTFWFEDGSFIKTQIFAAQYPAYKNVIECDYGRMWPVPDHFFKAVESVAAFSENGSVYFKNGQVVSNPNDETPSFYRIDGLPEGVGFNGKYVGMIAKQATRLFFTEDDDTGVNEIPRLFFVGENLRGVIAGLEKKAPAVYRGEMTQQEIDDANDEIPF